MNVRHRKVRWNQLDCVISLRRMRQIIILSRKVEIRRQLVTIKIKKVRIKACSVKSIRIYLTTLKEENRPI